MSICDEKYKKEMAKLTKELMEKENIEGIVLLQRVLKEMLVIV